MLTARDDVHSKVRAFDEGVDDYVTKPFAFDELLARIRARTRAPAAEASSLALQVGNLRLDLRLRRVYRGEQLVEMSNREFALLEYFMRHAGQVLSRRTLLAEVWNLDFDPGSNILEVYVRYLRRKLDTPGGPSCIATVRGSGYRFTV
jgi:DNA-binding response OmpR family regulator